MIIKYFFNILITLCLVIGLGSCASYEQFKYITEEYEVPTKVFKADFNMSWQAVMEVVQRFDLAMHNQEAGIVKTRWIDNTLELNFADSFGKSDTVKAAKFKLIINVVKGFRGNREVAKVGIFKRQLIEQDFLQGWKEVPTDGIQEKTILYRIERTLAIERKLKKIEEEKAKEVQQNDPF